MMSPNNMNEDIKNYIDQKIREHSHSGIDGQQIGLSNIYGFIPTMDTVPDHTPRNLFEQFVIYTSGATLGFYWYDTTNNLWHYVTATP